MRLPCRRQSGLGVWPERLVQCMAHRRRFCSSLQKANFTIFPAENSGMAGFLLLQVGGHTGWGLTGSPQASLASSHHSPFPPLSSSHSRSFQPPGIHTPAGFLPKLFPLIVYPPFPLSQVISQLIFQAVLLCHFLQEAFPGLSTRSNPP